MIKLSIIMPVYNVDLYLEDCLESLVNQDVTNEDYEIICINDGSTDTSGEILKDYANKYNNIKVINKENGGVSSARNTGIDTAKGKYIWFVDSDDFVAKGCISYILKAIDKHSPDVIRFFYKHVKESSKYSEVCAETINNVNGKLYKGRTAGLNVCTIINSEIIHNNNLRFNSDMKYGEDIMFMYYVYVYSKGEIWTLFNNYFYYYRDRENSAMNTRTAEIYTRRTKDLLYMSNVYKEAVDKKISSDEEIIKNTKNRQYLALLGALTIMPRSNLDYKKTMKALKEQGLYPFPWILWHAKNQKSKKKKLVEGFKLFFKFRPVYRLYYLIMRK